MKCHPIAFIYFNTNSFVNKKNHLKLPIYCVNKTFQSILQQTEFLEVL